MKINYKLALESLDELEKGAMRQAMILDDREGGHWNAEEVQDHYSDVKLALEQAEKLNMGLRIALNSVYGATSTKINTRELAKKAFESLEKIDHTICLNINEKTLKFGLDDLDHIDCKDFSEFAECYDTINSTLKQANKEHKVLELIKAKKVDTHAIIWCCDVEEYNMHKWSDCNKLTKREFVSLKEVFGNEKHL